MSHSSLFVAVRAAMSPLSAAKYGNHIPLVFARSRLMPGKWSMLLNQPMDRQRSTAPDRVDFSGQLFLPVYERER